MNHFLILTSNLVPIAYIGLFSAVYGAFEQDTVKLAVPDAMAQKAMTEIVRDTYGEDFNTRT